MSESRDFAAVEIGSHVEGTYMGSTFTGTVTSRRAHTINHKVTLITVSLDEPCHIAQIDRTETSNLMLSTSFDGSALNGCAGNWGDETDHVRVA